MASRTVNGSKGHHKFTVTITENSSSISIPNNTSSVSWTVTLAPIQNGYNWIFNYNDPFTLTLKVDGSTYTYTLRNYDGSSTVNIGSGSKTITHSTDGSKSITWSFSFADNPDYSSYTYLPGSGSSGNQTLVLTTIPRYGTSVQSLKSKTETSITMNWSSDNTVDYIWYSSNGGSNWTGVNVTDGTSGSYTISGLSVNTSYSIKTRIRRKDSQLTTDSSALSVTTYAYPYANSLPNFNIGNSVTIGVYNPLGRTYSIAMIGADNSVKDAGSYSGTSVPGWNGTSYVNFLYASIPSATSGTYKIRITYGSHSETRTGGTYYAVKANALPTAGTLSYVDTTSAMIAITGDSSKIVQNKSSVRYTVTGAAGNKSATISSVKVAVNGQTYTLSKSGNNYVGGNAVINSGTNVTATVTVTDSRGYTNTTSKTVTMLAYANPTATISLNREGNYYTPTTLKVKASCSNLNGENSVTIKYHYAQSGGSYNSWTTINNNTTYTVQLDNNYAWNVQVRITDTAGGTTTYTKVVQRGMPLMYWDTKRTSIGVGMFPNYDNSLCLDIRRIYMQNDGETGFTMYRSDYGTSANAYLVGATDGATGFAFRFMKPGDSSWTYSSRICYEGVLPYSNNGSSVGSSTMQWGSIYGKTIYENGTSLTSKYAPIVSTVLNNDSLGWSNGSTVASGSWVTVGSYKFPVGRYLIMTRVEFAGNASGNRQMMWTSSNTSTSAWTQQSYSTCAGHNGWTNLQSVFYASITTSESKYLRVIQSSGSALATYVYVQIIGV